VKRKKSDERRVRVKKVDGEFEMYSQRGRDGSLSLFKETSGSVSTSEMVGSLVVARRRELPEQGKDSLYI